jgi:fructokinase
VLRLGIDLGGTKTEIIGLDDGGRELLRRRVASPVGDYRATLETLTRLVNAVESELGERGTVGLATPGSRSRATGLLRNSNSVWLNGRPLQADLEQALSREVRIANDANCFALSEAVDGAGADMDLVFGVIVGTGTGGGIVIRRQVWSGPNGIAGEWGHNPLPWPGPDELPGPRCYCGHKGCIETFLSGPGMAADHLRVTGRKLSARQIAEAADRGDPVCVETLRRYVDRMARALAQVINTLDPDVIVLGGGLSKIECLYTELPRAWADYVFSDRVDTALARPRHGDSGGVRGAAWLWNR